MIYHLSYDLEKIVSPLLLVMQSGKKMFFQSGLEAAKYKFEIPYCVEYIRVYNGIIEIYLSENNSSTLSYNQKIIEDDITTSPFF